MEIVRGTAIVLAGLNSVRVISGGRMGMFINGKKDGRDPHIKYTALTNGGIPEEALLHRYIPYQALNGRERTKVEAFLLSRKNPAAAAASGASDAATRAGMPAGSDARNVLNAAYRAYAGDGTPANPGLTPRQKAKVDRYLLTGGYRFIGKYKPGSAAYNALTPMQRAVVDQVLRMRQPGSKEYEGLDPDVRAQVIGWKRLEEAIGDGTRELKEEWARFLEEVPFLGRLLKKGPQDAARKYDRDFNPDRIDNYVTSMTGPEAMREAKWKMDQVMQGTQDRLQEIIDGTGTANAPGPYYRLGTLLVDDALAPLLRRNLANMEGDIAWQMEQMDVSLKKMYRACEWYRWHLERYPAKVSPSVFEQWLSTLFGKLVGESTDNEPIVPGGRFAAGPHWN